MDVTLSAYAGNPTGAVYPEEMIVEIAQLCKTHNAWLVVDEAYEHFVYDGERCARVPLIDGYLFLRVVHNNNSFRVDWVHKRARL